MPRLQEDSARLDQARYARSIAIRATFADVDTFQHLNNVAIARFFEEGRASLNMGVFGVDAVVRPSTVQLLFASVAIEYIAQGEYPGTVDVGTAVSHIGRSSFVQSAGLFQGGRCLALCDAVTVYAVDGRAAELPSAVRDRLEDLAFRSGAEIARGDV